MKIDRDPEKAARRQYDLIVVGGGIYGVMLALEASLRDLVVLLLEKEDFGGATSYNSLRIVHGGLRDLQNLDLRRYWEFGRERRWFLEHFPEMVEPLPVLVPLYQRGLLRTDLFRIAFFLDRLLLPRRDRELSDDRFLPYGSVLAAAEVKQHFPQVQERGLHGGGLWYDACVPDSQRLILEVLRRAYAMDATALNYMPAVDALGDQNQIEGVRARDTLTHVTHQFASDVVINTAGPWVQDVASGFDQRFSELDRLSLGWNILLDREAPSDCALGVRPPSGAQVHFLHPWKGRLLAGTGYAPRNTKEKNPKPSMDEIHNHLEDLNEAVPALQLRPQDILHVFAGYLPAEPDGVQLAKKDLIIDHAKRGGPRGLYSVRSTKLTAARATAEKVLLEIFPNRDLAPPDMEAFSNMRSAKVAQRGVWDYGWYPDGGDDSWLKSLSRIIEEESVCHLDDLLLRRTSLGDNPFRALELAPELCGLFDWDSDRCQEEIERVEHHFRWVEKDASESLKEDGDA